MKQSILFTVLVMMILALSGCIEEEYETDDDSDSYSYSDIDALAGPKVSYSYSCPEIYGASTGGGTIDVTDGACQSVQEDYAYVFGCNLVDDMQAACEAFYSCTVNNSSGEYAAYYQQYLDSCSMY